MNSKSKSILFVDDEEIILATLASELQEANYSVTTAGSGEEALPMLKRNRFDLVITDLVMECLDGIEVLKVAKRINPETRVFVLTGYASLKSAINALRLGADDYLLKPCDPEELLAKVSRCLDKKKSQREVKIDKKTLPVCMYCGKIRYDTGKEHGIACLNRSIRMCWE